jgi:adenylate cyclase, class 1
LALARESFYLKVMGSSASNMDMHSRSLKEDYLETIAEQWQWPLSTLANLKKQHFWDIQKATQEHNLILQQLSQCFRMILGFAHDHVDKVNIQSSNDQKLIGRKLYSFLEKKPSKIEIITTRHAIHSQENEISIVESNFPNGARGWSLYVKKVHINNAEDFEPINKARTLMEIFCWLVMNGLYQKHLLIHFSSASLCLENDELQLILSRLDWFFSNYFDIDNALEAYQTANLVLNSLVFINLGISYADDREDGMCRISERSDVLSYGSHRQCFVATIDLVSVTSWSELTTHQYYGIEGLFNCLLNIVNNKKKPLTTDDLVVVCNTPVRGKSIATRIETVFGSLIKHFSKINRYRSPRFVLAGEGAYYIFEMNNKIVGFRRVESTEGLLNELASPQTIFSPIYLDQGVLEHSPIPLISTYNKPKAIQIFYQEFKTLIKVYILDERGSLFIQQHEKSDINQLLHQYSIFLQSILNRNLFKESVVIEHYEIHKNSTGLLSCSQVSKSKTAASQQLKLRISGETTLQGIHYTIYCNEEEFSSLNYGNQLFLAAYQHILEFRLSKQNYPVYISDIDLPLSAFHIDSLEQLQTIHYLNYKQKIEGKLNV